MIHKEDMIENLVIERGYTKKAANQVLDDVFEMISNYLTIGESVMVRGFGKFEVKTASARESVMPNTLERYTIPATKRVTFSMGKALRAQVRGE